MVKIISVVITGLYLDQNFPDHPGTHVTQVPLEFLLVEMSSDPSYFNPFQSNFSANRILPSSCLFWTGKGLVDYL
jgi:hypothetical protein